MIDPLASLQSLKNLDFLVQSIFGNDQGDMLADGFLGGVAEQPLRARYSNW